MKANTIMKNGYSLIEMLIILMIISIFSTIIIIDYSKQKSSNDLAFAVKQVIEDMRAVQNNTVNTLKYDGSVPLGGYGVKFSTSSNTSYVLFADSNANRLYDPGTDGLVRTATLPRGIVLDSVETNLPSSADAAVVFTPPYGVIYINEKNASNNSGVTVVLTLQIKKGSAVCPSTDCKTLEFTSEGKISK